MDFNKFDPKIITVESEYFKETSKYYKKEDGMYQFMIPFQIDGDRHHTNEYGYGVKSQNGNYYIDLDTKYSLNKYGFRSKEFIKNDEFVVAGCSYTYGMGVPEEYIWGNVVAKKFNVVPTNLGVSGGSVTQIIDNIFAYFYHYGNPKILLCLFPDFDRLMFPNNDYLLTSKNKMDRGTPTVYLHQTPINKKREYSRRPYYAEEVIGSDFAYYLSVKAIQYLIQYCKSSNIKLLWSTWQPHTTSMLLDMINNKGLNYDNFIPVDFIDNFAGYKDPDCKKHDYLKEENAKIFEKGGDYENDDTPHHFGTHQHAHIAESFIKAFKNIYKMPL
jgi:hypothetical protein